VKFGARAIYSSRSAVYWGHVISKGVGELGFLKIKSVARQAVVFPRLYHGSKKLRKQKNIFVERKKPSNAKSFVFFFNEVIPEAHLLPSPLITLAQENPHSIRRYPGLWYCEHMGLMLSAKETSTVTYFFN